MNAITTGPSFKVSENNPQPTSFEPLLLKGSIGAQAGRRRAEDYLLLSVLPRSLFCI